MNWASIFQFIGTDASTQGLIWAIVALGVFISYRILNVADMSVDALFPFAGIISLKLISIGMNPVLSLLIAVLCGILIGLINASLHVFLHIDPLLAGIIVMIALYTPNVIISKGNIAIDSSAPTVFTWLKELFDSKIASRIVLLAVVVIAVFILIYWFFGTELGLSLRAAGKNQSMAKANGINTSSRYILGLTISSALIALAGALYGQSNGYFSADAGRGSIIIGLAIIFLGDVIFGNKSFKLSLISLIVGGLIYWLIIDIIIEIPNFNTNYLNLTKALFITVIVCLYELKKKLMKKKAIRNSLTLKQGEAK